MQPDAAKQISVYSPVFLLPAMQIGVGVLGFERIIAKEAGYDAWVSVLIAGAGVNVLIWLIYKILTRNPETPDLFTVHRDLFGRSAGGLLSSLFIIYFAAQSLDLVRTYLEVIQVWMFPAMNIPAAAALLLLLIYSYTIGGFRVIAGFCLIGTVIVQPLLFLKLFPLQHAHYYHLIPHLDHSAADLLNGAKRMTVNYLGFEMLLIYFPFIKEREKSQKWAQSGALYTCMIYLVSALTAFAYYSEEQLKTVIWATLTLWKIVNLPFIERFEYAGISIWLFNVLPSACLAVWAVTRGMKLVYGFRQKNTLRVLLILLLACCILLTTREQINWFNTAISGVGFYMVSLYIPVLFICQAAIYRLRGRKK